jgi:hypothetical protein
LLPQLLAQPSIRFPHKPFPVPHRLIILLQSTIKISHNATQMLAPGTGYDPSGLSVAPVPVLTLHLTTCVM